MTPAPTDVSIQRAGPEAPAPAGLTEALEVLRLIADPMRAAILDLLAREQLCTCHLQEALGAKQTLISHHLKALREAGLVETEPCGRFTYYRLATGAFDAARDALAALADASGVEAPKRPC
jgi:ArsR family transcriptional regulator